MVKAPKKIELRHLVEHKHKHRSLVKFFAILATILIYFLIMSFKLGFKDSFFVTLLSWSFFVLCTPIADGGFLIDFPLRVIGNIRMLYTEIGVWLFAIMLNLGALIFYPVIYDKTSLLSLFNYVLVNPFPFWLIIMLSAFGTFMSILFGDELLDVLQHKHRKLYHAHAHKYYWIVSIFLIVATVLLYDFLIMRLGISF